MIYKAKIDANGCWIWQGHIDRGYGRMRKSEYPGRPFAHRVIYETLIKPIQEGFTLHHLCKNTSCVNPFHMQEISREEHRLLHLRERCRIAKALKQEKKQVSKNMAIAAEAVRL